MAQAPPLANEPRVKVFIVEFYLDESGFFLTPTQKEMQELAQIGETLLFLDRFKLR